MPVINTGVYKITNLITNKIYIGSSVNISKRIAVHLYDLRNNKHSNQYLQRAFNKYGVVNLKFDILEITTKEKLLIKEQFYIDLYKSTDVNIGYNLCKTAGNTLGFTHSEATKQKMSSARKGVPKPQSWVEQRKLRPMTDEHKLKLRTALQGRIPAAQVFEASKLKCSKIVTVYKEADIIGRFSSINNAAKALKVDKSSISKILDKDTRTCKKLTFKTL